MKSKTLLAITLAVFVAVLGTAYFMESSASVTVSTNIPEQPAATSSAPSLGPSPSPTPTPSGYTLAQVAQHNSASSCWTAIDGNVYNLTNWINQHPGGPEAILSICGTDGSAAFNAQHGGQSRPEQELANFLLGPLSQ